MLRKNRNGKTKDDQEMLRKDKNKTMDYQGMLKRIRALFELVTLSLLSFVKDTP